MSTRRDFPHPVLDPTGKDYPDCGFQAATIVEQTADAFSIDVTFDVGSRSIEALLKKRRANYALQVHCPRTAFRRSYVSSKRSWDVEIPESLLRDTFSVTPLVVSAADFKYQSNEFAAIFRGLAFDIRRGYVMAIGPTLEYPAEKDIDDLNRLGSIFQVIRNKKKNAELVEYDFESQKILILLPPEQFARYDLYRNRRPYADLFVTSLILPGLTLALDYMKTLSADGSEVESADESLPRWQRALEKRLEQLGLSDYDSSDSFTVAQKLLENPMRRAFAAIDERESREE
jgi:hypothetical protein